MTFPYPRIIAFMRVDIKVIKCISIPAFLFRYFLFDGKKKEKIEKKNLYHFPSLIYLVSDINMLGVHTSLFLRISKIAFYIRCSLKNFSQGLIIEFAR